MHWIMSELLSITINAAVPNAELFSAKSSNSISTVSHTLHDTQHSVIKLHQHCVAHATHGTVSSNSTSTVSHMLQTHGTVSSNSTSTVSHTLHTAQCHQTPPALCRTRYTTHGTVSSNSISTVSQTLDKTQDQFSCQFNILKLHFQAPSPTGGSSNAAIHPSVCCILRSSKRSILGLQLLQSTNK